MIFDPNEFAKELFKTAQRPVSWLLSAERLRDAAEVISEHELANEIPYFKAYAEAQQEAVAEAYSDGKDAGVAEIKAVPPNYPPAQLLYAYAIENVLKGLVIANTPRLIEEQELNEGLKSHNLIKLAEKAGLTVHVEERLVLEALSQLSVWAGRYPVARTRREHVGTPNSDELLDYGSAHPVMRGFFERARKELESRLQQPIKDRFGSVVVFRQPGT
ncbi:MAG: hypothetical protein ACLPTZ_21220 [Beijerinckiaceae bacterium]